MLLCPWDFPGKSTGVGCHFLLHWVGKIPPNPKNRRNIVTDSTKIFKNGLHPPQKNLKKIDRNDLPNNGVLCT